MGKGQKRRGGKSARGRKKQTGAQIHRKAYWVNLSQSLAQHRGWTCDEAPGPGLRGRWSAAVQRPLGQLDVAQLVLLLTQGVDADSLHLLWPVIHARLERDAAAGTGSSLLALMLGQRQFWSTHPHAQTQMVELLEARRDALARAPGLESLARDFTERSS
ncbi:hypothetical protein PPSIR1_03003 [Plesiocystis pacifica SIR-1]|uniref:Uncharacterized protein n=1 Tax=Plesiocystis pacifica SIR-1 TaxID=391625 RepID=A6G971_9BACT|nr:hypothetical protein [Plesiocystis pacifica]EDM77619.1 hypothetical protein PPSIR1_03003 [Plesiocystis pacifica SIR-1]